MKFLCLPGVNCKDAALRVEDEVIRSVHRLAAVAAMKIAAAVRVISDLDAASGRNRRDLDAVPNGPRVHLAVLSHRFLAELIIA